MVKIKKWNGATKKKDDDLLFLNYPQEPIGRGNPYYRCVFCKKSAPEINGILNKHLSWCEFRLANEEK